MLKHSDRSLITMFSGIDVNFFLSFSRSPLLRNQNLQSCVGKCHDSLISFSSLRVGPQLGWSSSQRQFLIRNEIDNDYSLLLRASNFNCSLSAHIVLTKYAAIQIIYDTFDSMLTVTNGFVVSASSEHFSKLSRARTAR